MAFSILKVFPVIKPILNIGETGNNTAEGNQNNFKPLPKSNFYPEFYPQHFFATITPFEKHLTN